MSERTGADPIAIVGGGQAGASCAERLRKKGYDGRIVLIGAEPYFPYQRPPLSKKYLSGEWERDRLLLRPETFWRDQDIELKLGTGVTRLDADSRKLLVGDEEVRWSRLLLATGTRPRRLPGVSGEMSGVHVLRGIDDVDRLAPAFKPGAKLVVIGGGYVGLETAAVAVEAGLEVTVVEAAPRILARVTCEETADFFRDLHRARGVTLLEGQSVRGLCGGDTVTGVRLENGELPADLVLVGIGAVPETRLAEEAGIACDDGILVDARGRTSAPDIWAAGDCARFDFEGVSTRLENVQNAINQAETTADDMLGEAMDYAPVPWFWSDQYDVKLQIAGIGSGHDRLVPVIQENGRSHWYFRVGKLIAVDAINDGKAFMTAKRLLATKTLVDPDQLTRPGFEPRQLLAPV
ncbi:FAD-dependent oxidoreductase [uncultured Roseibium sp.]|uniref:NAD(P)/FAD-dependent oxidoreductase n=1 Tax=uncultured Roseibium sp. TaxID=1936171 RepID=UPI003217C14A